MVIVMLLSKAVDYFILQKRLAGLSDATVIDYVNIIGVFSAYVGKNVDLSTLPYNFSC